MFLNDWENCNIGKIMYDFDIDEKDLEGVNILLASYEHYCYEGDAFVLFKKGGKLYEVNASHCSCYGLEGQWKPEETSIDDLVYRACNGTLGTSSGVNVFKKELLEVLWNVINKNVLE